MKVLLTHAYYILADWKEQAIMKPYAPLGLLSISAYLEKHEIEHDVFDSTFSSLENQLAFIQKFEPQIIGIYCNLMTKVKALELMSAVQNSHPKCHIVVGGPDVRYNVDNYLKNGAHVAVIGEGEESFLELVNGFGENDSMWKSIEGIAYMEGEQVQINAERKLLREVDNLPTPAYHKIDTSRYLSTWKDFHGLSMLSVSTQRGCPYTCKWCSTAVYGLSYRRKNAENVVSELMQLKRDYNVDAVWFVDDVFTVSHKWLFAFNAALKKENFKLPFECITRADRLNKEVLIALKEAGCFRVWIGAESGSQKIIDAMDRRVQVKQVREMIRTAKEVGIETGTFIMLGYPGEELEDIQETIDHLVYSDPDQFTITLAYPIKGTILYDEVKNIQLGSIDWVSQTDRERDFKRNFSSFFYKQALRHVVNEVKYQQLKKTKEKSTKQMLRHFAKAKLSRTLMQISK